MKLRDNAIGALIVFAMLAGGCTSDLIGTGPSDGGDAATGDAAPDDGGPTDSGADDTGPAPGDSSVVPDAGESDAGYPTTIVDALFEAEVEVGPTFIDVAGTRFGAEADALGPIGGGPGYLGGVESSACDVSVSTVTALVTALGDATAGDIICIDGDAELDVTDIITGGEAIELPGGVTLASDRGRRGSLGAVLISTVIDTPQLIRVTGPDARITGLRLMGPDPLRREEHWCEAFCSDGPMLGSAHYYTIPNSRGVRVTFDRLEIDNCEVAGFSHVGIYLVGGEGHHIHHSFIHHNQRKGLGYGITHDRSFSLIERNLFDYARHSIAGTGNPGSGYEARHNVERGHSISHNFDMHGGSDRGDGTNIAGTYTRVLNNTFFEISGERLHTGVVLRGVPEDENVIESNWFAHATPPPAIREQGGTVVGENAYGMPTPTLISGL